MAQEIIGSNSPLSVANNCISLKARKLKADPHPSPHWWLILYAGLYQRRLHDVVRDLVIPVLLERKFFNVLLVCHLLRGDASFSN